MKIYAIFKSIHFGFIEKEMYFLSSGKQIPAARREQELFYLQQVICMPDTKLHLHLITKLILSLLYQQHSTISCPHLPSQ